MLGNASITVLNVCDVVADTASTMFHAPRLPSTLRADVLVDPPGSARMWLPKASLSQCIKCAMVRDTRLLPGGLQQGPTHLPASPCCTLSWFLHGTVRGDARHTLTSPIVFTGPQQQASAFEYQGPVHGFMLLFLPDAFMALTGVDLAPFFNRSVPVDELAQAAPWLVSMCAAVAQAPTDDARVALIEAALDERWQAARPASLMGALAGHLFDDWAQTLGTRAATTGLGRSLRQVERRIKSWTGQPLRELKGVGRSERAFFDAVMAQEHGALNWAEVADEAGFSDQSHLCRQTRRITGFSPEELRRRISSDEGFWAYRLWGFSEARPSR